MSIAPKGELQWHARDNALTNLWQSLTGGKPKVVERQVVARHDNWYLGLGGVEFPGTVGNIDKLGGYRLKEQHRPHGTAAQTAHRQGGVKAIVVARELAHLAAPGLCLDVGNGIGRELVAATQQSASSRHGASHDEIVFPNETLLVVEHWSHVLMELHRQYHDGEAYETGKRESHQLRWTDVRAQEFPHQPLAAMVFGLIAHSLNSLSTLILTLLPTEVEMMPAPCA